MTTIHQKIDLFLLNSIAFQNVVYLGGRTANARVFTIMVHLIKNIVLHGNVVKNA